MAHPDRGPCLWGHAGPPCARAAKAGKERVLGYSFNDKGEREVSTETYTEDFNSVPIVRWARRLVLGIFGRPAGFRNRKHFQKIVVLQHKTVVKYCLVRCRRNKVISAWLRPPSVWGEGCVPANMCRETVSERMYAKRQFSKDAIGF